MDDYENPKIDEIKNKNIRRQPIPHYYGDLVRRAFIAIAFIMLVSAPIFQTFIRTPVHLSILVVVILVLLGGFTNPKQKWVHLLSVIVSALGVLIFGLESINSYASASWTFELATISIAVLFLFSLYFSVKTYRGFTVL